MNLTDLIAPESVVGSLKAVSKKQAIQDLSERVAERFDLPAREVFDQLLQRERLGSTGIGNGIAIPHARLRGIDRIYGAFARLEKPIDFESIDDEPVDLVFLLLAPEGEGADHLKALARIARAMRDQALTSKLRASRDATTLYTLLSNGAEPDAA